MTEQQITVQSQQTTKEPSAVPSPVNVELNVQKNNIDQLDLEDIDTTSNATHNSENNSNADAEATSTLHAETVDLPTHSPTLSLSRTSSHLSSFSQSFLEYNFNRNDSLENSNRPNDIEKERALVGGSKCMPRFADSPPKSSVSDEEDETDEQEDETDEQVNEPKKRKTTERTLLMEEF